MEILSGFTNGIFLVLISVFVMVEAVDRLIEPQEIHTERLIFVSTGGLIVNLVGVFAFSHAHSHGGSKCNHAHGQTSAPAAQAAPASAHGHSHGGSGGSHGHSHGGKPCTGHGNEVAVAKSGEAMDLEGGAAHGHGSHGNSNLEGEYGLV
jgi:solute carrier family 30 (zinc transporter), member 5/7